MEEKNGNGRWTAFYKWVLGGALLLVASGGTMWLNHVDDTLTDLRGLIEEYHDEMQVNRERIVGLEKDTDGLSQKIADLRSDVQDVRNDVQDTRKAVQDLKTAIVTSQLVKAGAIQ